MADSLKGLDELRYAPQGRHRATTDHRGIITYATQSLEISSTRGLAALTGPPDHQLGVSPQGFMRELWRPSLDGRGVKSATGQRTERLRVDTTFVPVLAAV